MPDTYYIFLKYLLSLNMKRAFLVAQLVKNPSANTGDTRDSGSVLGSGRSPGERNDYPLQYSCLENSMDEEPSGLQPQGHKESDTTEHACTMWKKKQVLEIRFSL